MKVIYYQVNDASTKLKTIVAIATEHFEKKEPLLILAPNQSAVEYLDLLLWRYPEESFLPHTTDGNDLILITDQIKNETQTTTFFNLCQKALPEKLSPKLIYELEDLSSPEGQEAFKNRFQVYREKKYAIQCK